MRSRGNGRSKGVNELMRRKRGEGEELRERGWKGYVRLKVEGEWGRAWKRRRLSRGRWVREELIESFPRMHALRVSRVRERWKGGWRGKFEVDRFGRV